jgi:chromosome segregation ATPase
MNDRPTIHEIELGRLTKKLNKIKDQRDKARKDLEYYKKVVSMQPYIAKRYESYENRIAEIKRVKDLEARVQEQAKLIDAMKELNWKVEAVKARVTQMENSGVKWGEVVNQGFPE